MDTKLKAKWVKALRSGKYKQGRGMLLDGKGRMCCLGVLESICRTPKKVLLANPTTLIPVEGSERGVSIHVRRTLALMNDGDKYDSTRKPKTFKQIATYIEKNL